MRSDGVALVHAIEGAPRARIVACEWRECPDPERSDAALAELVREQRLAGTPCVATLPPHQYRLHLVDAPEVEPDEIPAALRWLVKDLIAFPIEDAVVDWFPAPEARARGAHRRIQVVVARAAIVERAVAAVEKSGLALESVDVAELALRNVTACLEEDAQGLALLELRARGGLLATTRSGLLQLARGLEFGLDALLDAGARSAPAELDLEERGDELLDGLVLEVQRCLDYYESQIGPAPIAQLMVAPLERPAPQLLQHLEKNLNATLHRLDLNERFEAPRPLPEALQARCLAALGAALRAPEPA